MAYHGKSIYFTVNNEWEDGDSFGNFCLGAQNSKLKTAYSNFVRNSSHVLPNLNLSKVGLGSVTYISTSHLKNKGVAPTLPPNSCDLDTRPFLGPQFPPLNNEGFEPRPSLTPVLLPYSIYIQKLVFGPGFLQGVLVVLRGFRR